ncbi:MAG: HAD hydrolase-like protein [Muribaculaceae bacterium]|nr:HAD hydrolase-like protein [Muribaculaceae bacterium]
MEKDIIVKALELWKNRTGNNTFQLKAALIDMDGTLYDSMRNHTASWYRLMTEQGIECTLDEFYLYEGMTGASTITQLWQRQWHKDPSPELITELYHRKTVYFNELPRARVMDGAVEMTQALTQAGVKTVLVTGSGQPSVLERLDKDFPEVFPPHHRVTARNVTKGKPHPEPYLTGMQLADVKPWESIAIENAPIGVQSAVASGAFTIAVTTGPIPRQELEKAGAHLVLDSMPQLAGLMPEIINELI